MPIKPALERLATDIAECTRCPLHATRRQAVAGSGSPRAEIMLIGSGPGFHDDEQGRPFAGAAGKFLDELLGYCQLRREQVFLTTLVKCRLPAGRGPLPAEVQACAPFIERQLALLSPKIIVTLGTPALLYLLPEAKLALRHGRTIQLGKHLLFPTFDPAEALRQAPQRHGLIADFKTLATRLAPPPRPAPDPDDVEQLDLL